jgi:hypothetical protein
VYLCLYPASKQLEGKVPLRGHGKCPLCKRLAKELHDWTPTDPDSAPPSMPSALHGGKSAGSAGIPAELLRFPRPDPDDDDTKLFLWRMDVCTALATFYDECRAAERVPTSEGFTESVITPLLKKSTPGNPVDPANPDHYRGIAAGNTIPKLYGLILLQRLTHWCAQAGVVPPNQAGFMLQHSAEHHVFALLETLKHRARCKQDTYLLFLDLKKAYDSVHLGALWYILEKMGIPASFINTLRDWSSKRKARVMVNGELSEEFDCTKGLPQGDVLSPLLFNLYISVLMSLIRKMKMEGTYTGARWPDLPNELKLAILDLWYADDMVALAETPEELQALLDEIDRWSKAWGLEVGLGQGKTNVMFVSHTRSAVPNPPHSFTLGGKPVEWVSSYRYLGFDLRQALDADQFIESARRRIDYHAGRLIRFNRAVQSLSIAFQLQLINSNVLGCVNYLMAVLPVTALQAAGQLDVATRGVIRHALCASRNICTPLLYADTGFPLTYATILMHRYRLGEHLRLMDERRAPAVRVYKALEALRDVSGHSSKMTGPLRPWTALRAEVDAEVALIFGSRFTLPSTLTEPKSVREIRKNATLLQRSLSYGMWRMERHSKPYLLLERGTEPSLWRVPPDSSNLRMHLTWLMGLGHYDTMPHRRLLRIDHVLGDAAHAAPLSSWGSAGSGALIALCTKLYTRHVNVLLWARTGMTALRNWPFNVRDSDSDDGDASATGPPNAEASPPVPAGQAAGLANGAEGRPASPSSSSSSSPSSSPSASPREPAAAPPQPALAESESSTSSDDGEDAGFSRYRPRGRGGASGRGRGRGRGRGTTTSPRGRGRSASPAASPSPASARGRGRGRARGTPRGGRGGRGGAASAERGGARGDSDGDVTEDTSDMRCRHCEARGQRHIWHLAMVCPQSHLAQYRRESLWPRARALLKAIPTLLEDAYPENTDEGEGRRTVATRPFPKELTAALKELKAKLPRRPSEEWWSTPDMQHVLYRLLLGVPFSAFDVRTAHPSLTLGGRRVLERPSDDATDPGPTPDPQMPVSLVLGRIFDLVILPNARLRTFANTWMLWSVWRLIELAGVHRCALSVDSGTWGSNDRQVPCPLCRADRPSVMGHPVPDLTGRPGVYMGSLPGDPRRHTSAPHSGSAGAAGVGAAAAVSQDTDDSD